VEQVGGDGEGRRGGEVDGGGNGGGRGDGLGGGGGELLCGAIHVSILAGSHHPAWQLYPHSIPNAHIQQGSG
jgi:hypothetical protein